jgi:hypothetical protein
MHDERLGDVIRELLRRLAAFGLVSLRDGGLALRLVLLIGAGFSHSPMSLLGSLAVPVGSFLLYFLVAHGQSVARRPSPYPWVRPERGRRENVVP